MIFWIVTAVYLHLRILLLMLWLKTLRVLLILVFLNLLLYTFIMAWGEFTLRRWTILGFPFLGTLRDRLLFPLRHFQSDFRRRFLVLRFKLFSWLYSRLIEIKRFFLIFRKVFGRWAFVLHNLSVKRSMGLFRFAT